MVPQQLHPPWKALLFSRTPWRMATRDQEVLQGMLDLAVCIPRVEDLYSSRSDNLACQYGAYWGPNLSHHTSIPTSTLPYFIFLEGWLKPNKIQKMKKKIKICFEWNRKTLPNCVSPWRHLYSPGLPNGWGPQAPWCSAGDVYFDQSIPVKSIYIFPDWSAGVSVLISWGIPMKNVHTFSGVLDEWEPRLPLYRVPPGTNLGHL